MRPLGALHAGARLGEPRADGRRLERRIGDDEGARPIEGGRPRLHRSKGLDACAFGQPDREGEDRPAARIVGERQLAAHEADQPAGDREPEPCAFEAAGVRAVALLETVEDRRPAIRRDARPGVDHREPRRVPFAALDGDADAALIGELDRVAGEIGENLAQAQAIRADEARRGGADRGGDFDAFALRARREQLDHALDQLHEIDRLDDEVEMARLDLGEIEDFVDERDQRAPRAANGLDVACVLGIERGPPQQVGHAEDAADRGADLVAHRRQKARFGLVRRFGPVARGGRFLEPPELVAQGLVFGGDSGGARFRLMAGAGHGGRERERHSYHRAGLKAQCMNGDVRQTRAQIHGKFRSPRASR